MDLPEISDRMEIADVVTRYTRAIDTGDWDRLDTVFTPDAQIDYTESGGIRAGFAEVKPWLAEMLPAFFPKRMHTIGQLEIVFTDPDRADVVAYFDNPMPHGRRRGRHQDRRAGRALPPRDGAHRRRLALAAAPRRSGVEARAVTSNLVRPRRSPTMTR